MSFVRDDHAYTRGVGAVAAMDGNPRRRHAAAREALGMVRRDRMMATQTLGAIRETGGRGPAIGTRGIEVGVLDRPPFTHLPLPGGTGGGGRPTRPPKPGVSGPRVLVKSPGSVIKPPTRGGGSGGGKPPRNAEPTTTTFPGATTTYPEAKPPRNTGTATPYGGGGSGSGGGGGGGQLEPQDELDLPTDLELVVPVAPPAQARDNMLMYAAIGVGIWLLLRKK